MMDTFVPEEPSPETLRLYMPLSVNFYEFDDGSETGLKEEVIELDTARIVDMMEEISAVFREEMTDAEALRGLMLNYPADDSVNDKVRSMFFRPEYRRGAVWCVAECAINGKLDAGELDTLKEYVRGQTYMGFGNRVETHFIDVEEGELSVQIWSPDKWFIRTEQEEFRETDKVQSKAVRKQRPAR